MGFLSCFNARVTPVQTGQQVKAQADRDLEERPVATGLETPSKSSAPSLTTLAERLRQDPISTIRNAVIGQDFKLATPFGSQLVTYADYTASGRCLDFVEDFMAQHVMPTYANTHTEASATGLQTTRFVEEARQTIKQCVNAGADDVLIFTGTGSTGAIAKLIGCLEIWIPHGLDDQFDLVSHIPEDQRPVVFVGPMEHHSNEVMWRETIATVVPIDEDEFGFPSLEFLRSELERFADRPIKIGSFSAGSNVTGLLPPQAAITNLLHEFGGRCCWDFAGCGPYVTIDMNPADCDAGLDAAFISPHKFVGGPGTPGILVAKKHMLANRVPNQPGGGTVTFVDKRNQWYHGGDNPTPLDIAHREEGGTPGILQIIKAGLAFAVKQAVGDRKIEELESELAARAIRSWESDKRIVMIGHDRKGYKLDHRMTILSFNIRFGDRLLSAHFVISLLNDVYGIQARSGCSCTGPYGHRLYGIDDQTSARMCKISLAGEESIKPGWARLNLNYFISNEEAEFIIAAVHQIAEHGWKLLPFYRCDLKSGAFTHRDFDRDGSLRSMSAVLTGSTDGPVTPPKEPQTIGTDRWIAPLDAAKQLYDSARVRAEELLASGVCQNDLNFESEIPFSKPYQEFRTEFPHYSFAVATDALDEMGLKLPEE